MPPHCDTLDGPVAGAAKKALEARDVNLILAYAPKKAEDEIKAAFARTLRARKEGGEAAKLADQWFYETVVRLHREGEGAPYTGLKPAGLDWGPVVPKAEKAIEGGNPREVIDLLKRTIEEELQNRFNHAMKLKDYKKSDVGAAREYVEATLGFELYAHHLYTNIKGGKEHGEATGSHEHSQEAPHGETE